MPLGPPDQNSTLVKACSSFMSRVNWSPMVCAGEFVSPIDQRVWILPSRALAYFRSWPMALTPVGNGGIDVAVHPVRLYAPPSGVPLITSPGASAAGASAGASLTPAAAPPLPGMPPPAVFPPDPALGPPAPDWPPPLPVGAPAPRTA